MARQSRLVVPHVVHHVVARGVNGTDIFRTDEDKIRYLSRAAQIAKQERVLVHGYCLLNNHVHFLLTPASPEGLARFFSKLHTWWAVVFNRQANRTGHLFQARYYSSPLSECHYRTALRYVEMNAVRAKLAKRPEDWRWSSARYHLRLIEDSPIPLTPVVTRASMSPSEWKAILQAANPEADGRLRRAHRCSNPCGPPLFVRELEERFGRRLPNSGAVSNSGEPFVAIGSREQAVAG